jgi:hypothetical protein
LAKKYIHYPETCLYTLQTCKVGEEEKNTKKKKILPVLSMKIPGFVYFCVKEYDFPYTAKGFKLK